jgi:hypothetical protein
VFRFLILALLAVIIHTTGGNVWMLGFLLIYIVSTVSYLAYNLLYMFCIDFLTSS